MALIFVDCEAFGGCPAVGRLTEFGAVEYKTRETFHGVLLDTKPTPDNPVPRRIFVSDHEYEAIAFDVFTKFEEWLRRVSPGARPVFVSDNPAFDWQWINDGFWKAIGSNPFGHSARRISDFYAGLCGDFHRTQQWKKLRITRHDHNPVHDALGNAQAFARLLAGER